MQGTSMAAPHVAGVISLMTALRPDLGWQEALAILQASAGPLSTAECDNQGSDDGSPLTGSDCGAGLINAFLALQYARDGTAPPASGTGLLQFRPAVLDLGTETDAAALELSNIGTQGISWELTGYTFASDNPGAIADGAIHVPGSAPDNGFLNPGQSVTTRISIDRSKAPANSNSQIGLVFEVDGTERQVLELRFSTPPEADPGPNGPMIVAAFIEDSDGELTPGGQLQRNGAITDFHFDALAGRNIVAAWSDENDNGKVDAGDYFGSHPIRVTVTAGREATGIAVQVTRMIDGINLTTGDAELISKLELAFPKARRTSGAGY
jgi:serine protease